MSECDREASTMRRPWPTGGLLRQGGGRRPSLSLHEDIPVLQGQQSGLKEHEGRNTKELLNVVSRLVLA